MGRGLGPVQLTIISALRQEPNQTPAELASLAYGCAVQEVTQSQLRAVNKAMRSLHRYCIVEQSDFRSLEGEPRWKLGVRAESSRKVKPPPKVAAFKPRVVAPTDP